MKFAKFAETWPSSRQKSSTLFHRTTGSTASDAVPRGVYDEEEGQALSGVVDDDSPSPPRVYGHPRRPVHKRAAAAATRRNGALCFALCVSAVSLVWIITRDDGASASLEPLGPLVDLRSAMHKGLSKSSEQSYNWGLSNTHTTHATEQKQAQKEQEKKRAPPPREDVVVANIRAATNIASSAAASAFGSAQGHGEGELEFKGKEGGEWREREEEEKEDGGKVAIASPDRVGTRGEDNEDKDVVPYPGGGVGLGTTSVTSLEKGMEKGSLGGWGATAESVASILSRVEEAVEHGQNAGAVSAAAASARGTTERVVTGGGGVASRGGGVGRGGAGASAGAGGGVEGGVRSKSEGGNGGRWDMEGSRSGGDGLGLEFPSSSFVGGARVDSDNSRLVVRGDIEDVLPDVEGMGKWGVLEDVPENEWDFKVVDPAMAPPPNEYSKAGIAPRFGLLGEGRYDESTSSIADAEDAVTVAAAAAEGVGVGVGMERGVGVGRGVSVVGEGADSQSFPDPGRRKGGNVREASAPSGRIKILDDVGSGGGRSSPGKASSVPGKPYKVSLDGEKRVGGGREGGKDPDAVEEEKEGEEEKGQGVDGGRGGAMEENRQQKLGDTAVGEKAKMGKAEAPTAAAERFQHGIDKEGGRDGTGLPEADIAIREVVAELAAASAENRRETIPVAAPAPLGGGASGQVGASRVNKDDTTHLDSRERKRAAAALLAKDTAQAGLEELPDHPEVAERAEEAEEAEGARRAGLEEVTKQAEQAEQAERTEQAKRAEESVREEAAGQVEGAGRRTKGDERDIVTPLPGDDETLRVGGAAEGKVGAESHEGGGEKGDGQGIVEPSPGGGRDGRREGGEGSGRGEEVRGEGGGVGGVGGGRAEEEDEERGKGGGDGEGGEGGREGREVGGEERAAQVNEKGIAENPFAKEKGGSGTKESDRSEDGERDINDHKHAFFKAERTVVAVERPNVRPPTGHADRWAKASRSGNKHDHDHSPPNQTGQNDKLPLSGEPSVMLAPGVQAAAASSPISRAAPASGTSITGHGVNGGGGADGGEGGQGEGRGGDGDGGGIGGERAAPCRLEGRVENWEPSDTADLKSAYRWKGEKKMSMNKIRHFSQGGSALRDLIHDEVVRLDILRHELFCD